MCLSLSGCQPKRERGKGCNTQDIGEHHEPAQRRFRHKIHPLAVLQVKERNRNRKAEESERRPHVILAAKRAPNTERKTASNGECGRHPPALTNVLPSEPPEQCNECPTAQAEEDDSE